MPDLPYLQYKPKVNTVNMANTAPPPYDKRNDTAISIEPVVIPPPSYPFTLRNYLARGLRFFLHMGEFILMSIGILLVVAICLGFYAMMILGAYCINSHNYTPCGGKYNGATTLLCIGIVTSFLETCVWVNFICGCCVEMYSWSERNS